MESNNTTSLLPTGQAPIGNLTGPALSNQTFFETLANLPAVLIANRDLLVLEARIVFSAMACIYIGSYGSLRRPPSAKASKRGKKSKKRHSKGHDDPDEPVVQGLLPSDAIVFPIMAGTVLIGLYYLIKWLEEPNIINQVLRAYFSAMSLASLGKLFADILHMMTGFLFPTVWLDAAGTLHHVDPEKRDQWHHADGSKDRVWDDKKLPLPDPWADLNLSAKTGGALWQMRHLLSEEWTIRLHLHGIATEKFKVKFNDILGVMLAIIANLIYYNTESIFLSNVMGYAFSYAGIILMSPTTFTTGSAVLFGLFFYDIYMVFYTPYMVTVATKLDVPIKLVFQGPQKASMLGLGDIVLPGMMIGLCMRFDHYMYYYRQYKLVPIELETHGESSGQEVVDKKMERMVIKPEYTNPQGQWGDRFWGTRLRNLLKPDATPALKASAFPKTYFHAAMVGYLLAMVTTLAMLLTFNHAQPALLYLVPGVVLSVWITGAVRGELREMWEYTEDGSLDKTDVVVEVDRDGNVIKQVEDKKDTDKTKTKEDEKKDGDQTKTNEDKKSASEGDPADSSTSNEGSGHPSDLTADGDKKEGSEVKKEGSEVYPVFLFSIEAPEPAHA
ncbi:signal peptide peptidase-domain-containing protein [Xylariomycetidae sp. FL2044]|nr:signal peptide peptidase-domain-containing protein [Xylariomycetidae sp. FL2044]